MTMGLEAYFHPPANCLESRIESGRNGILSGYNIFVLCQLPAIGIFDAYAGRQAVI
jgi:hypothetical protein